MKICKECGSKYDGFLISHSSKYCSEECRKKVRARVNFTQKSKRLNKLNNGDIDFIANDTFKKYKQRAPSRGLEFTLTLEFFKKNVNANCHYCDEFIDKVGFDRLDNKVGYTEENSVPCCNDCNFMKRNMSVESFIKKCKQISKNFNN
jgi:hypothetical protein